MTAYLLITAARNELTSDDRGSAPSLICAPPPECNRGRPPVAPVPSPRRSREQRDESHACVAAGGGDQLVHPLKRGAATQLDVPSRSLALLLVSRQHVDDQSALRAAETDHRHCRNRVEHELLRGSRLQTRGARDDLGAD